MPVITSTGAKPEHKQNKKIEKNYKDPLNSWGIRALMYSSEIGATVNEIAPKLTFALWVPSFMYLGADIYDKYKNDKNEFSPSSKRGVKEAIRQAFSFFILPTGATILGQKLTSPLGKLISDKLSINAKDGIYRHTKDVIDQSIGNNFNNKDKFKTFLINSLKNKVTSLENSKKTDNIFKKFHRYLKGDFSLADSDNKKLYAFAEKNANLLFEIKDALQNNKKHKNIPERIYKKYNKTLPIMKHIYGEDCTDYALKTALKEYQNTLIVKNKITKTIGGVVSCLLLTQPISYIVNKILMPKYITPGVEIISLKFRESNLIRQHVEKVDQNRKKQLNSTTLLNVHEKSRTKEPPPFQKSEKPADKPQANQESIHRQQNAQVRS